MNNYFRPGEIPTTPRGEDRRSKRPRVRISHSFTPNDKRCKECGFLIRGENHKDGGHHRKVNNYVKGGKVVRN